MHGFKSQEGAVAARRSRTKRLPFCPGRFFFAGFRPGEGQGFPTFLETVSGYSSK